MSAYVSVTPLRVQKHKIAQLSLVICVFCENNALSPQTKRLDLTRDTAVFYLHQGCELIECYALDFER